MEEHPAQNSHQNINTFTCKTGATYVIYLTTAMWEDGDDDDEFDDDDDDDDENGDDNDWCQIGH